MIINYKLPPCRHTAAAVAAASPQVAAKSGGRSSGGNGRRGTMRPASDVTLRAEMMCVSGFRQLRVDVLILKRNNNRRNRGRGQRHYALSERLTVIYGVACSDKGDISWWAGSRVGVTRCRCRVCTRHEGTSSSQLRLQLAKNVELERRHGRLYPVHTCSATQVSDPSLGYTGQWPHCVLHSSRKRLKQSKKKRKVTVFWIFKKNVKTCSRTMLCYPPLLSVDFHYAVLGEPYCQSSFLSVCWLLSILFARSVTLVQTCM